MKKTTMENLLKDGQSYYMLIIAISKLARQRVELANEVGETSLDDPVGEAVELLKSDKYEIIEPEEV